MAWNYFRRSGPPHGMRITKSWRYSPVKLKLVLSLTAVVLSGGIITATMLDTNAYGPEAFVMVVKTDNPGTSNSTSFTIRTTGTGYNYNVDCDDDGVNEVTGATGDYTCVYGSVGTYTVAITGTFPRVYYNEDVGGGGDRRKLLEIEQWGTGAWTSMEDAFHGANNLRVTATDAPNLSVATNLEDMFRDATVFNDNIDHWDVSNVTNMRGMFWSAPAFNQPLNSWDTGAVTNMSQMFGRAFAFNQPLDNWDTSSVTNMSSMFEGNLSSPSQMTFNGSIGSWDVSNVTNMGRMFYAAGNFNQDISGWNTASLADTNFMFNYARAFNQPLNSWDMSNAVSIRGMFQAAIAFNQPLDSWNTGLVTNMSQMFNGASSFNQSLGDWDVSNVTTMTWMLNSTVLTPANYDLTLAGWASQPVQPGVTLEASSLTYFDDTGRAILLGAPNNWTILDDGFYRPTITSPTQGETLNTFNPTVTGVSAPNLPVRITIGSNVYSTAAGADGAYSYTITPELPHDWYNMTVNAIDQHGNPGASRGVSFRIQTKPSIASPANEAVISDNTPTVTGVTLPNRTVNILMGGTPYTTTSSSSGNFSFTPSSPLSDGWRTISVYLKDISGGAGATDHATVFVSSTNGITLSGSNAQPKLSWPVSPNTYSDSTWTETAQGASSFPVRGSFDAVSFGGKLWIMGGQGVLRYGDIWSSNDGIDWTQEVTTAPWTARNGHQVVVFDDKIWIMGGQSNTGRLNDVWSSPDGINWTQETANAGWAPRNSHQVVVHDEKLWVMGGNTSSSQNDVWNSEDGITWTEVTDAANWPIRHGFAAASFDGKLWVLGGIIDDWDRFVSDIWSSEDGVSWVRETPEAPWLVRASHQVEVMNGKLWVLGGSADGWDSEYNDVWFSEDGRSWVRTAEQADWEARRGHTAAVHDGSLWVLGGRVGPSWTNSNDVWRSSGISDVVYTVCWDRAKDGCANIAQTTNLSFTLPQVLGAGTWYFTVTASSGDGTQVLGAYTSEGYVVTDQSEDSHSDSGGLAETGIGIRPLAVIAFAAIFAGVLVVWKVSRRKRHSYGWY